MISLIDDDDGVREATASLLQSLGYEVRTFDSARAFLDWNGLGSDVTCVITDIMMPGIDGFELHHRLRDDGRRFPIIFLTALSDTAAMARMKNCAVHAILIKPCSQQSLIESVESALALGRRSPSGGPGRA